MFNNDKINKNKEAAIIEGPEAVLNSNEENNPKITDNKPPIIEYITILWGLDEIFLAIAAGIISIPVINNMDWRCINPLSSKINLETFVCINC